MIQMLCEKITGHRWNKLEGWADREPVEYYYRCRMQEEIMEECGIFCMLALKEDKERLQNIQKQITITDWLGESI